MGKTFCCSDLHGRYDLFEKIRDFMGQNDTCFVLGDCIDRGPDSIKLLLEVMADKRFVLIKGNHEQMMYDSIISQTIMGYSDFDLWFGNGGYETYLQFMEQPESIRREVLLNIKKAPMYIIYGNTVLSHAGFEWSLYDSIEDLDDLGDELIWGRSHIYSCSSPRGIQVHGHTPIDVIKIAKDKTRTFHKKNKICIDMGSCFSNRTVLLDLDSFEEYYFESEEKING